MKLKAEAVEELRLRLLALCSEPADEQLIFRPIEEGKGLLLVFGTAMRLKMPRSADIAESTEDCMRFQEYSSRMKSSTLCSTWFISFRQTQTASAMMVVPVIQAFATAS